jgi:hypothetical protein
MDRGQTGGKAAQAEFDAADAGTRAALINYAHGKAFIEDQDRLEGVPERAAEMNAEIAAEAPLTWQEWADRKDAYQEAARERAAKKEKANA